jgi:hypothetical protein
MEAARPAAALPVVLRPRAVPLAPAAVVARGKAAAALASRLARRDDAALGRLSGVGAPGLLLLIGAAEELPWVDGVVYLGRDPEAPSLLLPTLLEPDVPAPLFERAILARARGAAPPIAVLVDSGYVGALVGAGAARAVGRAELSAFLGARS